MQTTRNKVLDFIRQRGESTAAEVAAALDLSVPAARRHLDLLRAEGLVDVRVVRHGVGRPSFVFFLTEEAEELAPAGYTRLLTRVVDRLVHLTPDRVSGRQGRDLLGQVFEDVALDVAEAHRGEVTGVTLEERVEQVSEALRREGIVDTWRRLDSGYVLANHVCPYRRAALATEDACRSDRLAIQLLLDAPVEQVGRIAAGDPCCEYVVRAPETEQRKTRRSSKRTGAGSDAPGGRSIDGRNDG
ncbi:MAG TPA: ArsR family transcriptional regulator [Dehalococcoidia bacterium]|nr:ArsR family transcriptional regulator [Dehalococcoidia bacterium]